MIEISHKIEILPNNKQNTCLNKAFGCARFAYNWGLSEWIRRFKNGEKINGHKLKKIFNSEKKEKYPFVCEVTKYATQQSFIYLQQAYDKFFRDLKGSEVHFPKFKSKKNSIESFYIGGDIVRLSDRHFNTKTRPVFAKKKSYLYIQKIGWIKMTEFLRFNGKINSVTIKREGNKIYACFQITITKEEYNRTHNQKLGKNRLVGIDFGLNSIAIFSDGIKINNNRYSDLGETKRKKILRKIDRKVHPRTKDEKLSGVKQSNNYKKAIRSYVLFENRIKFKRIDFTHKLSSIITNFYSHIAIEDLPISKLIKTSHWGKYFKDVSLGYLRRQLTYKTLAKGKVLETANRFYPSSKTCSCCGYIKKSITLRDRIFSCEKCGLLIDRDFNASLNLKHTFSNIGMVCPEFTPVDLEELTCLLNLNNIQFHKVKAGIQLEYP